jgi:hypothetical protein
VPYHLFKLAPGSYDVILNGVILASLVRAGAGPNVRWTAELLVDLPREEMPRPFADLSHEFASLEEACRWLGISERETARAVHQQDASSTA